MKDSYSIWFSVPLFFWYSIVSNNCQGQSNISKLNFHEIEVADSLYEKKNYDEAASLYHICASNYSKNSLWGKWFNCINRIRRCRQNQRKYNEAISELLKYERIVPINERNIVGKVNFIIGYVFEKKLEFPNSIKFYKKALERFDDNKNVKNFVKACYNNLSINYSRIGDQRSAIDFANKAIDYCKLNGMETHLCDLYSNKGQYFFYDGQYSKALNQYFLAFDICEYSKDCSFIHTSIAELLLEEGDINGARKHLDFADESNQDVNQYYSIIKNRYLFSNGEIESAKKMLPNTLELIDANNDTRNLIKETTKFAQFLFDTEEQELAVEYAHKAISLFYENVDAENVFDRPNISGEIPYSYVIESLRIKARYFKNKYQISEEKLFLEEAYFYYNNLLLFFDLLKNNYYSTSSKYRMGEIIQDHYAEAISFFIELYQKDPSKVTLERAFNLSQRANSFVLRNAISDRKALQLANVSQDSVEKYLHYAWETGEDSTQDSTMRANTLIEFDKYRMSIKNIYPSYGKYEKKEEISIDEIQTLIQPNSLLIKYYYHNNTLSVFGITNDTFFAENIELNEKYISLIDENVKIVSSEVVNDSLTEAYLRNSKFVYDLVLGNLIERYQLKEIDHLLIVPDGPLKKVSFSSLAVNDSKDSKDPYTFLIGSYAVNYLYYCSQLRDGINNKGAKGDFIGFGIEYNDEFLDEITEDFLSNFKESSNVSRALTLSPLEYADDEAVFLANLFDGQSFINSEVTRNRVVSAINKFDVVHISAHAFVDNNDYLNSYVVLNKNEEEKFQLGYADILNLDLNNELVVLSACQTSNGENVLGEGLMSLSRAFVQSGSKSTVGAYWNAPDYATKELMSQFYLNLDKGYSKSKAMQQAQIEFMTNDNISSPTIRSPFFWGSWAVYGNDRPIEFSKPFFNSTTMISFILVALFGILLIFMFKVSRIK